MLSREQIKGAAKMWVQAKAIIKINRAVAETVAESVLCEKLLKELDGVYASIIWADEKAAK